MDNKIPTTISDSSNLTSISDIAKSFKTKVQLQTELERIYNLLSKAKIEMAECIDLVKSQKDQIKHLETMLKSITPVVTGTAEKMEFSVEEEIALKQLDMLRVVAMSRPFTPEEAKIYDILVKNKRLAQGNSTLVADYKKLPRDTSEKTLLQIAEAQIVDDHERKS